MKKSDIIGGAIAYIALVVITYQCIFGWAEHTADDNSRVAQETYISPSDQVAIELMGKKMNESDYQDYLDSLPDDMQAEMESDYYEYERYLYETGQAFDELPF